jgi:hypothetical protein|uniref:Uncharacterized protein n=1 Tax=Picea glauca TaxID=3330 RepID=A0A101M1I1_PICGL|nr:hypothetical protein ABT39_MTgene3758 [Picea glauca]
MNSTLLRRSALYRWTPGYFIWGANRAFLCTDFGVFGSYRMAAFELIKEMLVLAQLSDQLQLLKPPSLILTLNLPVVYYWLD